MSGAQDERRAFAYRLRALCAPLIDAGWLPVATTLFADVYEVTDFGAQGRGMPALLRRDNRCVEVTGFASGDLRVAPPFGSLDAEPDDLPSNALAAPASLSAAELEKPGQPGLFYEEHGLLP